MEHISQLDARLIDKIAAGEVVERPASVVKELVENSLDAGASKVHVTLEDGGRRLIAVRDDGHGIPAPELPLAFARHATSKIRTTEDLFNVATFGFRGEALAAISGVAKVRLLSRAQGAAQGSELTCAGGSFSPALQQAADFGTAITVEDLFFNVPARQKFLKSSSHEMGVCQETLEALACSHPDRSFYLRSGSRDILQLPAVATKVPETDLFGEKILRARLAQVWGEETVAQLIYIKQESHHGRVEGLISPPGADRASGRHILTFVNHRAVRDKVLRHGVLRGFHSHLQKGRYPMAALYVQLDPTLVDVNVHPAKVEVRFQYASELQNLIATAIREGLRSGAWSAPTPSSLPWNSPAPAPASTVRERVSYFGGSPLSSAASSSASLGSSFADTLAPQVKPLFAAEPPVIPQKGLFDEFSPSVAPAAQHSATETIPWHDLRFLGSFARLYLIFSHGSERLLFVDQHAFHERILYEQLTTGSAQLLAAQPLLVPELLEVSPAEAETLRARLAQYQTWGFQLVALAPEQFEIRAVPQILTGKDVSRALLELNEAPTNTAAEALATIGHHQLATFACHGAVRGGEELDETDLKRLLAASGSVDFYHNCPHGRPVFRWVDRREISGWFER